MTFVIACLALLVERFFDWSHLRHWRWVAGLKGYFAARMQNQSTNVIIAATILPVVLGVWFIQFLLEGVLFGFASLVFDLVVLLYCFGPKNLWADTFAAVNAISNGDMAAAKEKLRSAFDVNDINTAQATHKDFIDHIFLQASQRIFAVGFWFALLGPCGAVLYRLVTVMASGASGANPLVDNTLAVLEWVPVRIMTLTFALGGNFAKVSSIWVKKAPAGLGENETMLLDCGFAALGLEEDQLPEDGSAEKQVIGLIDRSVVIGLLIILLAVFIL